MLTNQRLPDRRLERAAWAAWVVDGVVCLVAAAVILPASIDAIVGSQVTNAWRVLDIAAVLTLHLVVAFARHAPRSTFVAACGAMLVLVLSPHLVVQGLTAPAVLVPSSLVFFYLLYVVALCCDSRAARFGLGISLLGAAVVSVRLGLSTAWVSQVGSGVLGWLVLTAVAVIGPIAAWSLGRLLSTRAAYREDLHKRALADAAVAERARIAAEMHDVVSHSLAVIVSQAEGGRMATADDSTREVLKTISTTGRTALNDMRSMLGVLRSPAAHRGDPQPDVGGIAELATSSGAELIEHGTPHPTSSAVGLAAYRITQESLTNALKHGTGSATVRINWSDVLELTITNQHRSVIGDSRGGSGIAGMRQRAEAAGGTLQAGADGDRWRVAATLPVEER